jgi:hypothetical protein
MRIYIMGTPARRLEDYLLPFVYGDHGDVCTPSRSRGYPPLGVGGLRGHLVGNGRVPAVSPL